MNQVTMSLNSADGVQKFGLHAEHERYITTNDRNFPFN